MSHYLFGRRWLDSRHFLSLPPAFICANRPSVQLTAVQRVCYGRSHSEKSMSMTSGANFSSNASKLCLRRWIITEKAWLDPEGIHDLRRASNRSFGFAQDRLGGGVRDVVRWSEAIERTLRHCSGRSAKYWSRHSSSVRAELSRSTIKSLRTV